MAKLRLSEWASIAEVIGAAGVVISLIYVGVQVSENTDEVRAANRQQLVGRAHAATGSIATSRELASAVAKVGSGVTLTATEQSQYGYLIRAMLYDVQEAYLLYQEGRLEEEYWETRSALLHVYMAHEPARKIYHGIRASGVLHSDFVSWADQNIEK